MSKLSSVNKVYTGKGTCLSPLGETLDKNVEAIKGGRSGIQKHFNLELSDKPFYGAIFPKDRLQTLWEEKNIPGEFSTLEKMMLLSIYPMLEKYKRYFNANCGLIFSTTKGNIDALSSSANASFYLQDLAKKIARVIGIKTEPIILSNACVSGIMAVSAAKRLIQTGKYNHFLVVGGDLFSSFVFAGFQSFHAVSSQPCRPYDKLRDGITLGEATAALFISRDKNIFPTNEVYEIIGDGSINDANHISGPSRTGEGLLHSIQNALQEARIKSDEIDVISAHGTATIYNDEMEAQAFTRAHLAEKPIFSLKAYFGHTLGASGLLEAIISMAFASQNLIPSSKGYAEHGLTLPLQITSSLEEQEVATILKTASGFGGCNTAVIFKKSNEE